MLVVGSSPPPERGARKAAGQQRHSEKGHDKHDYGYRTGGRRQQATGQHYRRDEHKRCQPAFPTDRGPAPAKAPGPKPGLASYR
jgi:hypothetical protein